MKTRPLGHCVSTAHMLAMIQETQFLIGAKSVTETHILMSVDSKWRSKGHRWTSGFTVESIKPVWSLLWSCNYNTWLLIPSGQQDLDIRCNLIVPWTPGFWTTTSLAWNPSARSYNLFRDWSGPIIELSKCGKPTGDKTRLTHYGSM